MGRKIKKAMTGLAFVAFVVVGAPMVRAQTQEPRLALVIGESQYKARPVASASNDAGLVAETLREAGFEVVGAADLDQEGLRRTFRDFLARAQAAGPHALVFVYFAGRGVQYEGDNYLAPIDATIARDTDIPIEAFRVSDFTHALEALPLSARIIVLDAARASGYAKDGSLAGGLALVDPSANTLYAFNAAPGTVAPEETTTYGVYAKSLVEMLHDGGRPINEVFDFTRLRVSELTKGAVVPWDVSKIESPILFFAAVANERPRAQLPPRPSREMPSEQAYEVAVAQDTITAYEDFLTAYPDDPLARRVRGLLAVRREALTWQRAVRANTAAAFWSYLHRYPQGPHLGDARRRLTMLSASFEPPPRYEPYDFGGLPPPPEADYRIVDRPVVIFDELDYPPPPRAFFLPPPPPDYVELPPPSSPMRGFLPIPVPLPFHGGAPAGRPGHIIGPTGAEEGRPGPQGGPNHPAPLPTPSAPGRPSAPNHPGPVPAPSGPGEPNHPGPVPVPGGPGGPNHPTEAPHAPPPPRAEPPHAPPPHTESPHAAPPHVEPPHVPPPHAEPPHAPPPHVEPPHAPPPHAEPPHAPPPHVEPPHAPPPHAPPPPNAGHKEEPHKGDPKQEQH